MTGQAMSKQYEAALLRLVAMEERERLHAFWDLETQSELHPLAENLATVTCGLRLLTRKPIPKNQERDLFELAWSVTKAQQIPPAIICEINTLLTKIRVDEVALPSARTHMAAQTAIQHLPQPAPDWIVQQLLVTLLVSNQTDKISALLKQPGVNPIFQARDAIRKQIARGDVGEAFDAASKDQAQKLLTSLLAGIISRDYRKMELHRDNAASAIDRLRLWLVFQAWQHSDQSKTAPPGPQYLKKTNDNVEIASDPDDFHLWQLSLILEGYARGDQADEERLLSELFMKRLRCLVEPESRLLVLLSAMQIATNRGDLPLSQYFRDAYTAESLFLSNNTCTDVFHINEAHAGGQAGAPSGIARGTRLTACTAKLAAQITIAKIQQSLSRDQRDTTAARTRIMQAMKKYYGDLASFRGAIQKFGQLGLAVQADLPYEIRDEISRSLMGGEAMTEEALTAVLAATFGNESRQFSHFNHRPFALGSIGQVHRATLCEGNEVCVKVRYPNVQKSIKSDFAALRAMTPIVSAILPGHPLKKIIARWEAKMIEECDFTNEARQQERARKILAQTTNTIVPRVFHDLTTPKVLVTEYVDGQDFEHFAANASQTAKNAIAVSLWRSLYELLSNGMFRADIQPANYLIKDNSLVLLDFAMVDVDDNLGDASKHFAFYRAIIDQDVATLRQAMTDGDRVLPNVDWHSATDDLLAMAILLGKPMQGTFTFTTAYTRDVFKFMTTRLSKNFCLTPESIFSLRIFWSLFSMLAQLNATADWQQELSNYLQVSVEKSA